MTTNPQITSKSNPKFKEAVSLKERKNRYKESKFLIEGSRLLNQALENNGEVCYVFFTPDFYQTPSGLELVNKLNDMKISNFEIPVPLLTQLSDTEHSQGVIAVSKMQPMGDISLELDQEEKSIILLLDRIQDPGNLGTLLRTADAAGIKIVLCTKGTVDLYNEKVVRSTMGSLYNLKIFYVETQEAIHHLRSNHYAIYSAALDADSKPFNHIPYEDRAALAIGNEGNGLSKEILDHSKEKIIIPIIGKVESLNASIAGGILMYHMALE